MGPKICSAIEMKLVSLGIQRLTSKSKRPVHSIKPQEMRYIVTEGSLWMPKDTSFISMAEHIFGPIGRYMFWIIYLFFFFTIMVAHAVGGGAVLLDVTGWNVPSGLAIFIYSIVLAPVVYLGAKSVDRLNLFLISGVVVSYFAFIGFAADKIHLDLLQKKLRLAIFFGSAIPLIIYF